jgi:hypothetical protein
MVLKNILQFFQNLFTQRNTKSRSRRNSEDIDTSNMSAQKFAALAGIKVQIQTDSQEDLLNSTIISSSSGLTTSSYTFSPRGSFPKLDMSIFTPPTQVDCGTSRPSDSAELRFRRMSESTISVPLHLNIQSPNSADVIKKGRFTMTTEKNFHFQRSPKIKVSRFTYVDDGSKQMRGRIHSFDSGVDF